MKLASNKNFYLAIAFLALTAAVIAETTTKGGVDYGVAFARFTFLFVLLTFLGFVITLLKPSAPVDSPKRFGYSSKTNGLSNFSEQGFSVKVNQQNTVIRWTDIDTMLGFKADLLTTDCICLDVFTESGIKFRIAEDTPGWQQFLRKIEAHFPAVIPGWEFSIAASPFETDFQVIYDRYNRPIELLESQLYQD